uniref:Putative secreted protein n=1 Tax=Ixodes ricinus TaxID=34613 RepID=A0A6B0TSS3_IXORI
MPFLGSMLNFFLPMDSCLALVEVREPPSSCASRRSISAVTSSISSLSCWISRSSSVLRWRISASSCCSSWVR